MEEVLESIEFLPRNYGLMTEDGFFFSPAAHIMGDILRTSPEIIKKRFSEAQKYHLGKRDKHYKILFPWPKELLSEENAFEIFRESVKSGPNGKGVYNLIDAEPHEAVSNITLLGHELSAEVKPTSRRVEPYKTMIKSPFLFDNKLNIVDMHCDCEEHFHGTRKSGSQRTRIECMHIAAMGDEFYERIAFGNRNKTPYKHKEIPEIIENSDPSKIMYSPFTFVQNWKLVSNSLEPISTDRAVLEYDVAVSYFILGKGFFDINKLLLKLPHLYSSHILFGINSGNISYVVIRQGSKRKSDEQTIREEKKLMVQMKKALKEKGYKFNRYCLEMNMPAIRYENDNTAVNIVFSDEFPPFYSVRIKNTRAPQVFLNEKREENPFKQLNYKQWTIDDKTRIPMETYIRTASSLWIPEYERPIFFNISENMKKRYYDAIKKYSRQPEWDLRKAGLVYGK